MLDLNAGAAALTRLAEAATPGPWEVDPPEQWGPEGWSVYHVESGGPICDVGDPYPRSENHPAENMQLIRLTPDLARALAACMRALEETLGELDRLKVAYGHGLERDVAPPSLDTIKHAMDARAACGPVVERLTKGEGR